ncbi:hypothetical protein ES702_02384 [subsurface metagenome]
MNIREKPIGTENARRAAERFILDRYPYANVAFERAALKTDGTRQFYEVAGCCRLIKWPNSVGRKSQCEIQVDAYSADIAGYHGMEHVLSS